MTNRDRFDCAHCRFGRHCDESNPAGYALFSIPGVIESETCLLPMVGPDEWDIVRAHAEYKAGHLPHAGGYLDQPAAIMDAIRIIDVAVSEARRG